MALQFSKDEKKKEMRYKDLYDDLVANEEEWLEFLDHPKNSLFAMNVYVYHTNMHLFNIRSMSITKTEIAYFHV